MTNEDHVQAVIKFDSSAHADLSFSSISTIPLNRWRIQGTEGGILDDGSVRDGMKLFRRVEGMTLHGELRHHPTRYECFYENIHAHLAYGAPLDVPPEQARRVIGILEAAEKSAKSGQAKPVPYE